MVPIKEMTDVLKVVKETANLKPKMWVRLKRGVFKDDLAQVCSYYGNYRRLSISIIFQISFRTEMLSYGF